MKQELIFEYSISYVRDSWGGSSEYYCEVVLKNETTGNNIFIGTIILSEREFFAAKEAGTLDEMLHQSAMGLLLDSIKKPGEEV